MTHIEFAEGLPPDIVAEAVSWRRHLHRHPELAFNEHQTSAFIVAQLERFGLKVHHGLAGTGVVGTLSRGTSSRAIGIRADMDALPIDEQSGVAYASSTKGVMHACGHDGHVAIALAAARICAALPDLDGTVHFIFQPAEEGGGGAKRMIEEGLFTKFPCDAIYGLHNQPLLPLGSCVAHDGIMLAASAQFDIEITGRGCHGGRPHQGIDPVLATCQLVSSLQSIVSRNVDPVETGVVSVTKIRAGEGFNVIPDRCHIGGTARWLQSSAGDIIERRVKQLSASIAAGFGCEAKVNYERRYAATVNNPAAARFVREIASRIPKLTVENFPPTTGAEDFSEMLARVPGCFMFLGGARAGTDAGLHSARYDFNDDLVSLGTTLWVALIRASLVKL